MAFSKTCLLFLLLVYWCIEGFRVRQHHLSRGVLKGKSRPDQAESVSHRTRDVDNTSVAHQASFSSTADITTNVFKTAANALSLGDDGIAARESATADHDDQTPAGGGYSKAQVVLASSYLHPNDGPGSAEVGLQQESRVDERSLRSRFIAAIEDPSRELEDAGNVGAMYKVLDILMKYMLALVCIFREFLSQDTPWKELMDTIDGGVKIVTNVNVTEPSYGPTKIMPMDEFRQGCTRLLSESSMMEVYGVDTFAMFKVGFLQEATAVYPHDKFGSAMKLLSLWLLCASPGPPGFFWVQFRNLLISAGQAYPEDPMKWDVQALSDFVRKVLFRFAVVAAWDQDGTQGWVARAAPLLILLAQQTSYPPAVKARAVISPKVRFLVTSARRALANLGDGVAQACYDVLWSAHSEVDSTVTPAELAYVSDQVDAATTFAPVQRVRPMSPNAGRRLK